MLRWEQMTPAEMRRSDQKTFFAIAFAIGLIVLILSLVLAPKASGQVAYFKQYDRVEYHCEICGRSIYQAEEKKQWDGWIHDDMAMGMQAFVWPAIADSERAVNWTWSRTVKVCPECDAKYGSALATILNEKYDRAMKRYLEDNKSQRAAFDRARAEAHVRDLESQVKTLEGKLKRLREGKPEEEEKPLPKWKNFLRTDTINLNGGKDGWSSDAKVFGIRDTILFDSTQTVIFKVK